MTTTSTGAYADLGTVRAYYEQYGDGAPLILLHGGMHTIELSFGDLIPVLAPGRRLIAVEMQGHGRTADVERAPSLAAFADDLVALLDHLGLERADIMGFSLGGLAAVETAVRHPERVDRLVAAAVHFRADGYHEEIRDPALWATSTRMPTEADFVAMREAYDRVAPDPQAFDATLERLQPLVATEELWSTEELAGITAPTLLMIGDHDFVRLEHAGEMAETIPGAHLAVVPGATHVGLIARVGIVAPILEDFLARVPS